MCLTQSIVMPFTAFGFSHKNKDFKERMDNSAGSLDGLMSNLVFSGRVTLPV